MVLDDGTIAVADVEKMNAQHCARLVGMGARGPVSARLTNIPRFARIACGAVDDGGGAPRALHSAFRRPAGATGKGSDARFPSGGSGNSSARLREICEKLP